MGGVGSGGISRPAEIKKLASGYDVSQNPQMEKATLEEIINPPESLLATPGAEDVWHYYAPGLARAKILALADYDMLAEFCKAVAVAREASRNLRDEGHVLFKANGDQYVNPWHRIHKDAVNDMQRIAARFGLTPGDRARIVVPDDPGNASNEKDPGRYLS